MRTEGVGERRLLSIADQNQLRGILKFMFYVRSDCPVEAGPMSGLRRPLLRPIQRDLDPRRRSAARRFLLRHPGREC